MDVGRLPGDGRLDDAGLVRTVDQAVKGKLLQRAVAAAQEQLRSLVRRAHSVGDKKIAVRADPQDVRKIGAGERAADRVLVPGRGQRAGLGEESPEPDLGRT